MFITDVSIRRPVVSWVMSLILITFGIFVFWKLPVRELPAGIQPPVVQVQVDYSSAAAPIIDQEVTQVIEDVIGGAEGIKNIDSKSENGRSTINVEFDTSIDLDNAANDIRERVARVVDNLPSESDPPQILKRAAGFTTTMWLSLSSSTWSDLELGDYAERYLVDQFSSVKNVGRIRVGGLRELSIRVWIDPIRLAANDLTIKEVEIAMRGENISLPAGTLEADNIDLTLNLDKSYTDINSIKQLPIKKTGNKIVSIDEKYFRPTEVDYLEGDATKAKEILNWLPKITFREMISEMVKKDIESIISVFEDYTNKKAKSFEFPSNINIDKKMVRSSKFLTHKVFNSYHSETSLMRYIKKLENKDLSLTRSMISLGSCTMKLNAASEMIPLSWTEWNSIHPFVPTDQAKGYHNIISKLEEYLSEITGFSATSLQPNSGAQGEYSGLMVIKSYLNDIGQGNRNICLIPSSAHGTNPASAVMAGFKVVVIKTDKYGNIDLDDIKDKINEYNISLAALMITYPSTHGVFESNIKTITKLIHKSGGQVYMDGANMNAQVGVTSPNMIGADVCHLNLHKTFAIPHGGGGPGIGPICVADHLKEYLPSNPIIKTGGNKAIPAISSAPWGSALACLISYGYIRTVSYTHLTLPTNREV